MLCPRRVATAAEEDRTSSASNPYFMSIKLSDLHMRDSKASPNSKHSANVWLENDTGESQEMVAPWGFFRALCIFACWGSFWKPFSLLLWFGSCISKAEDIKNGCCLKLTDDIFIPNQCRDLIFALKNIVYLSNTHSHTQGHAHMAQIRRQLARDQFMPSTM